ncbi:cysteine desulfurase NifS [soil metagenome]
MPIYLDHAATTPLRREALDAMLPLLTEDYGNPSSVHSFGRRARMALDESRERMAANLGADAREIVFTAGGTEAINLAVKGAAWAGKGRGNRLVTSAAEHHAVLHSLRHLEKFGFDIVILPVDRYGRLDPDRLANAINDRTVLVSVTMANNEVGTIQPLADIVRIARGHRGLLLHVDAVQAAPYLAIDAHALDVDLLTVAAHKFEGPKGAGALYIKHGTIILPQTHGGSQERFRRAGTENAAAAVGMAVAYDFACRERDETALRLAALRDRLRAALDGQAGVELTGHPRKRLPGHLSLIARDTDGATVVNALDLDGIAISTGAACTTGSTEPSHVLLALCYPEEEARGSLRITLGRTTLEADVERAAQVIPAAIAKIRGKVPAVAADALGEQVGA